MLKKFNKMWIDIFLSAIKKMKRDTLMSIFRLVCIIWDWMVVWSVEAFWIFIYCLDWLRKWLLIG